MAIEWWICPAAPTMRQFIAPVWAEALSCWNTNGWFMSPNTCMFSTESRRFSDNVFDIIVHIYVFIPAWYVTVPGYHSSSRLRAWSLVCVFPPRWFRGNTFLVRPGECIFDTEGSAGLDLVKYHNQFCLGIWTCCVIYFIMFSTCVLYVKPKLHVAFAYCAITLSNVACKLFD